MPCAPVRCAGRCRRPNRWPRPPGIRCEIVDGLAEWDRQSSSYVPIEELRAANDPMWKSLAAGALHELGVDGPQFQGRVVATVDGIAAAHPDQVVAVVCHGGVLNAYLSAVLGLDRVLFFPPDYTCINRVEVGRSGKRLLRTLNEQPLAPRVDPVVRHGALRPAASLRPPDLSG